MIAGGHPTRGASCTARTGRCGGCRKALTPYLKCTPRRGCHTWRWVLYAGARRSGLMSTRFLTPISGSSERNTRPGAARSHLEPRGAVWSRLEPFGAAAHGPEQVLKLLGS